MSTWEPRWGFQDGVDGSSRPGLSLRSSSVWGLRNLGPGKLTLHTAVVDSYYPKCMLCSPEATRQSIHQGSLVGWAELFGTVATAPLAGPHLV